MGYGADRQLITRMDETAAGISNTIFVGGLYEKVILPNGDIKERHYVGGNTIVTYKNRTANSAGTVETRYLHKDHIGSTVLITDENGDEVESFSFDPWGKRRAATLTEIQAILGSWSSLTAYQKGNLTISALTLSSDITNKGFTGHEQLDGVNLIHMGGRVYDAEIGRFLSADPFVGDSTNLQALNRYSYVENNPLSYTDPSGFFLKKLVKKLGNAIKSGISSVVEGSRNLRRKVLRQIGEIEGLSIVISVALNFIPGCQGWCAMAFNAAMTDANGGTIGQVLTGAAIGMITNGVPGVDTMVGGGVVGALGEKIGNIGASMLISGTVSKAQGGKFIDGAKWAGIGSAIGAAVGGVRNAVNAGEASLGAAMGHIKWAFEDAMLPTANIQDHGSPVVSSKDVTSSSIRLGPIDESRAITVSQCNYCYDNYLKGVNTGWSPSASYGDIYNKASREAGRRNERLAIGGAKAVVYLSGGVPASVLTVAEGLYGIYGGFNASTQNGAFLGSQNAFSAIMQTALETGPRFNASVSVGFTVLEEALVH